MLVLSRQFCTFKPPTVGSCKPLKTSIYPNPAQDIVTIENPLSGVASITFYDVFGRSIRKCLLNDVKTAINVSNFENGIYFYIVQFGKNETKGKLIISR